MQTFKELPLREELRRALVELGFDTPSPIQARALPVLLGQPTDFIGLAATGTGKTAAFGLPLLERLDPQQRGVQALILCPTRELAVQVAGQIDQLGKHLGVHALPIYGGSGYGDQIRGLKQGAQIVVGTPGRVCDHMDKGTLDLSGLQTLVLDEADEMISMGFKDDLERVLGSIPEGQARTWLFSATMSPPVRKVADEYLRDPEFIQVNSGSDMVPEGVEQVYYFTTEAQKPELVCKVIDAADDFYGIIFCQTKALVADLTDFLKGKGYRADCLHGDLEQAGRDRAMNAFRDRRVSILVATDVACRGLDVNDVSHVVNYSIPRELDNYVHRIGRTGRIGKAGIAISLVTGSHRPLLGRIERMTRTKLRELKPPTRKDIATRKVARRLEAFQAETQSARAIELLGPEWKAALAGMSVEEIAGRFLALAHPELFAAAASAPDPDEYRPTAPNGKVISVPGRGGKSGGYNPGGYARAEGGYKPGGGYKKKFEGGYAKPEGGYKKPYEGGYKKKFEGGYSKPEGGYKKKFEGGYKKKEGPQARSGFPQEAEIRRARSAPAVEGGFKKKFGKFAKAKPASGAKLERAES